jgi:hypothetical protein
VEDDVSVLRLVGGIANGIIDTAGKKEGSKCEDCDKNEFFHSDEWLFRV